MKTIQLPVALFIRLISFSLAVTFFSCSEDTSPTVEEKVESAWKAYQSSNYSLALEDFRNAYRLMSEELRRVPEVELGLGWAFYRLGNADSSALYLERCLNDQREAIIPYSMIKYYDLNRNKSHASIATDEVLSRLKTFLTVDRPLYQFQYDQTINYKDGALMGAQIRVLQKNYADAVVYIQLVQADFNPDPNAADYIDRILAMLEGLVAGNG